MKKRNILRTVFPMLLALMMALGSLSGAMEAKADSNDYTYTVRIFAGNKGTIDGSDVIVFDGLSYNEAVSFTAQSRVTLNSDAEGKYHILGVREAGRDNDTVGAIARATADKDYVVAYGIAGSSVKYTVQYHDNDGNTIRDDDPFYGNVGDRPVVSYEYIEGYYPNVLSLTGTLSSDESKNVFTFTYSEEETETVYETAEAAQPTAPAATGGGTTTVTTTTTAGGGAAAAGGAAAGGAAAGGAAAGGEAAAAGGENIAEPEVPAAVTNPDNAPELTDIEDPNNPLSPYNNGETAGSDETTASASEPETANIENPNSPAAAGLSTPAKVGIGVGGAAVLAGILWFLLVYSKKKK